MMIGCNVHFILYWFNVDGLCWFNYPIHLGLLCTVKVKMSLSLTDHLAVKTCD
jgi:hypothetical protein